MAKRNDTPNGTPPAPTSARAPLRGAYASTMLVDLFERAAPTLTDADLHAVESKIDDASSITSGIHALCEKLGCYVSGDGEGEASRYGGFESREDLSTLLFTIGRMADHADGLLQIASMAGDLRAERASAPAVSRG